MVAPMTHRAEPRDWLSENLIGQSAGARQLRETIRRIARLDDPVWVSGEAGVGKDTVARGIHLLGRRSQGPLVLINLGAIPESLVSAELLGAAKGAFTGAKDRAGLLERADGGTLVLDELEAIPKETQNLLLQFLETSTLRRLGGSSDRPADVRVVSVTTGSPESVLASRQISEALLYRLAAIPVAVPPLRDRRADIPLIAKFFCERLSEEHETTISFSAEALSALKQYDYPGNVRQLLNVVHGAVLFAGRGVVLPGHLQGLLGQPAKPEEEGTKLRQDLERATIELKQIRSSSITASPIWEGRFFPHEEDYCFVLMPFAEQHDLQKVYSDHVKAVVETRCGLRCERADDIYGISGVMQSVWEGINRARLVVADLTGRNPNVFY